MAVSQRHVLQYKCVKGNANPVATLAPPSPSEHSQHYLMTQLPDSQCVMNELQPVAVSTQGLSTYSFPGSVCT